MNIGEQESECGQWRSQGNHLFERYGDRWQHVYHHPQRYGVDQLVDAYDAEMREDQ